MTRPNSPSIINACRQLVIVTKTVNGFCETIPPNIAIVTILPVTSAICSDGNQRDAKRTQLKKQKALPIPVIKRQNIAKEKLSAQANRNVPITHKNIAIKIIRLTGYRSNTRLAGNKNSTFDR